MTSLLKDRPELKSKAKDINGNKNVFYSWVKKLLLGDTVREETSKEMACGTEIGRKVCFMIEDIQNQIETYRGNVGR